MTLTPNGIKKMFALSDVPIPGSSRCFAADDSRPHRRQPRRSARHPEATALAGTTARWFVEALVGAPQRVGKAVVRPLEMLFGGVRGLVAPRTPTPIAAPPTAQRARRAALPRRRARRSSLQRTDLLLQRQRFFAMPAELALTRPSADQLVVHLAGPWRMSGGVPDPRRRPGRAQRPAPRRIAFEAEALGQWDSALLIFLERIAAVAGERGVTVDRGGCTASSACWRWPRPCQSARARAAAASGRDSWPGSASAPPVRGTARTRS
ncbi:MAG: hypothetical protein U0802_03225 [Candidatus Binatia bacterium]